MATEAELAILLKLHDEYSAQLKNAQKNTDSFGGSLNKVKDIASGFLAAGAVQQGLGMITSLIKGSVAAGEESIRVQQQLKSVIESTGGSAGVTAEQATNLASKYQLLTKFSDEQILSAENLVLTFTNIKSNIFPDVTKVILDMSVAFGQDLKSSAIQVAKALNDPKEGLTALTRVGVTFTEQQKEQIKTMVDSGHGAEAQKLILAELDKEVGGSATNLTSFEKKWRSITVAVDEGKESFGKFVIGGLSLVSDWVDTKSAGLENWWKKLAPIFEAGAKQIEGNISGVIHILENVADAVGKAVSFVEDIIHGRWSDAWGAMKDIALDIGKALVNGLAAMFGQIPNLLIKAVNAATDAISGKELIPAVNLGPLGHSPGVSIPKLGHIGEIDTTIFHDIGNIISDAGNAAQTAAPKIRGAGESAADFGAKADSGGKKAEDAAKKLEDAMLKMRDSIDSALDDNILSFQEFTNINKQALKDGLEPLTAAFAGHLEASKLLSVAMNGNAEDAYNLEKNLTKLQDVLKTSGVEAVKLGVTFAQDVIGKIKSAFSSLFGAPTKEEATLDLQIAEVQRRIAGFSAAAGGQDISNALKPDEALLASLQKQRDLMSANNDVMQKQFTLSNAELLTNATRDAQAKQLIEDQRQTSTWVAQVTTDYQRMSPEVQGVTTAISNFRQYLSTLMQGGSNDLRLVARGV